MNQDLGEKPILIFHTSVSDDKCVKCQDIHLEKLIQPELEDLKDVLSEKLKLVESLLKKQQNV